MSFLKIYQLSGFVALIGLILLAGHANLVEGASSCSIPDEAIQDCVATSRPNPWSISACLLMKYDTSSLIRCVGSLNKPRCYDTTFKVDQQLQLDNIVDGQVCVTPRNTLVIAASLAAKSCGSVCPSAFNKLRSCPFKGSEKEYRQCLCGQLFNNNERDCIDGCAGVFYSRSTPLDFGKLVGDEMDGDDCDFGIDDIIDERVSTTPVYVGTATASATALAQSTQTSTEEASASPTPAPTGAGFHEKPRTILAFVAITVQILPLLL